MVLPSIEDSPLVFGKKKDKCEYLHKPPTIKPNYGKKDDSVIPKTNVSRVLLYDNSMQDQMLEVRLKYFQRQSSRVRRIIEKNKHVFEEQQLNRRKWHEIMENRYQNMKGAFIAQYGTRYMPVPKEIPEADPFLINARLAPPINVLCYFLEAEKTAKEKKKKKSDTKAKENKTLDNADMTEYFYDSKRLLGELASVNTLYTHSIEDPRFRSLEDILIPPQGYNDGYLQISPGYAKGPRKRRRRVSARSRVISLPPFYTNTQ